jgi:hypothetical protein
MKILNTGNVVQSLKPLQGVMSCCGPQPTGGDASAVRSCPYNGSYPAWVTGDIDTVDGPVPVAASELQRSEKFDHIRARLTNFRMRFSIEPGLYAVGGPDKNSDVFISANYKMSFDILRSSLHGINAWILVLDTGGINVWCAAGKGTFGTDELVKRINGERISTLVDHRKVIVPQLGAPGVSAGQVKKSTGFRVQYGPVRASDIAGYIKNRYTASPEMRRIRFATRDRLVLTPMELNPAMKKLPYLIVVILLVFGLKPEGIFFRDALSGGMPFIAGAFGALFSGAFLAPVLLPFVPFRSFALKGWVIGMAVFLLLINYVPLFMFESYYLTAIVLVFFPLLSSYLALQFTGASTYTNLSGVKKELKYGLPLYIAGTIITVLLVAAYKIQVWGIL